MILCTYWELRIIIVMRIWIVTCYQTRVQALESDTQQKGDRSEPQIPASICLRWLWGLKDRIRVNCLAQGWINSCYQGVLLCKSISRLSTLCNSSEIIFTNVFFKTKSINCIVFKLSFVLQGLSEYQRNFLWKKSYLSESYNPSVGRRYPWAGLRSDQLGKLNKVIVIIT